jgi:hypothetical protein
MTQTTPGLPAPIINQTPIDDHVYEPAAQTT